LNFSFQLCTKIKGKTRSTGWASLNAGRKIALQLSNVFMLSQTEKPASYWHRNEPPPVIYDQQPDEQG